MSALCGMVDFMGAPVSRAALQDMAAASGRCGSRSIDRWIAGAAGLSHRPLHSTAASLGERQPVHSRDEAVHLVADARLDNREALASALRTEGALTDDCPGDAGLILAAYLRWGDRCLDHLLGDFAFAVWDARQQRLLLACDPLGLKPLHHARAGSLVCFASEAQQVLQHPAVPRRLDELTVSDYLANCLPAPERTFFHGVRRLPPGHRLVVTAEGERLERWWDLDPERRTLYRRDEDYAEHFLVLFGQAVKDRLRTGAGAVGILMSGGLDSASTAAVARRTLSRGCGPELFAASFVFGRLRQCDERERIQMLSKHLDLDAELVEADQFPFLGSAEACPPALETPLQSSEGSFRELLGRIRHRGARVLLTGHGADDVASGSLSVYSDRLRRGDIRAVVEVARHAASCGQDWSWVLYNYLARPFLSEAADRRLRRLTGRPQGPEIPDWIDAGFACRTGLRERLGARPPRRFRDSARQVVYDRFRLAPWTPAALWYDRSAAPFGIEVRHPFLDRRLIELLFSIPPAQTFRAGVRKPLLRRAMSGLLPDAVRLRLEKTRLGAYLDLSLREQRDQIEDLIAAPLVSEMGFVDGGRLRAKYRSCLEGSPAEGDRALWQALTLEVWLRRYGSLFHRERHSAESRPAA